MTVTNIAAYQFAPLAGLEDLRAQLLARCTELDLKGSILLAPEGINCFLAGSAAAIDAILADLRAIPGLEGLTAKFSQSERQPFRRMLVKLKTEIIPFGKPQIDPVAAPAPRLAPAELKRWLDEGRPVVLLDTRNDYEVRLGTFENAIDPQLDHFRHFPDAVSRLPGHLRDQPVVTFCTGGIRCEKAAPWLIQNGFREVYQLDGGILKYFEEVGGAHWQGECFVFDRRVALDPALQETATEVCWACQQPLTVEEQRDPRYHRGEQCPRCAKQS